MMVNHRLHLNLKTQLIGPHLPPGLSSRLPNLCSSGQNCQPAMSMSWWDSGPLMSLYLTVNHHLSTTPIFIIRLTQYLLVESHGKTLRYHILAHSLTLMPHHGWSRHMRSMSGTLVSSSRICWQIRHSQKTSITRRCVYSTSMEVDGMSISCLATGFGSRQHVLLFLSWLFY